MATRKRGYGEMAVNLALSLKTLLPDLPISVISDGYAEIVPGSRDLFDEFIPVPKDANPFETKSRMFDFSPYPRTLWLDADSCILRDPSQMLAELKAVDFACMEYRRHAFDSIRNPVWGTIGEIFCHYGLLETDVYPEYNSSVMYFNDCDENVKFFQAVNKAYNQKPCRLTQDVGGFFPDEVAYGVASARLAYYSELKYWQPAYLAWLSAHPGEAEIVKQYPILTMSGGRRNNPTKGLYNSIVSEAGKKLGIKSYLYDVTTKIYAGVK